MEEFRKNGLKLSGTDADDNIDGWNGKNLIYAGSGNDTVIGSSQDDLLDGGSGNDKLHGGDGNDTLVGSLGNDELRAGRGNNTLTGGIGNDYLEGSNGNDTYVFSKGDGQDTVLDGSYFPGGKDTLRLTDIALEEVQFRKERSDLILSGYNEGDSVRINNYFFSDNKKAYEIETFQFKDKTAVNPNLLNYTSADGTINAVAAFEEAANTGVI